MEDINLDTYKNAWKQDKAFDNIALGADKINKYLHGQSKGIVRQFSNGLWFDIVYKSAAIIAMLVYFFLFQNSTGIIIPAGITFISLLGLIYQFVVLRKLTELRRPSADLRSILELSIQFYYSRYTKSLLVSAVSNCLLFIIGSMFYFQFKYGEIRAFDLDDYVVFSVAILLSYGLGAWAYMTQFRFLIRQLEESLEEFDDGQLEQQLIQSQRSKRVRRMLAAVLLLLAGLLVLAYLVLT